MQSFPNLYGNQIVLDLVHTIQENAAYLSEIDGAIGDGDHGINMNKGFTRTKEMINGQGMDFSASLNTLGEVLLTEIGGAMGPLYGTFFMEMARICKGKSDIDSQLFGQMLKAAYDGVQDLGNARIGDKTLIDTLSPAYLAYSEAVTEGLPFSEALNRMSVAAESGKESTRDLVARVGRASRLGERSRGVLDAGATSCYLILKTLANSINHLLSKEEAKQ